MIGDNVEMSGSDFQPYLPDHKAGYHELEQIRPGVVMCPFCDSIIDATQSKEVKAAYDAIMYFDGDSWGSVPICSCPRVWAVFDPNHGKWAFRYQLDIGENEWH